MNTIVNRVFSQSKTPKTQVSSPERQPKTRIYEEPGLKSCESFAFASSKVLAIQDHHFLGLCFPSSSGVASGALLDSDGGVEGAVAIENALSAVDAATAEDAEAKAEDNDTSEEAEAKAEASDVACALTELCDDMMLLATSDPASGPSVGGSKGVSISGAPSSVWRPTGFRGSLSVPLLGLGSRPRESQTML